MTVLLWGRFVILAGLLAVAAWLLRATLTDSANDDAATVQPWRAHKR